MPLGTLIIRADANAVIGIGHVMRCIGIAQSWQDAGGECILAAHALNTPLQERIRLEGIDVLSLENGGGGAKDATEFLRYAQEAQAQWVIVDGYHFGVEYQQAVKSGGFKLLFADDYGHAGRYVADIVLNQDIGADGEMYGQKEPYTRLLLGAKYFALRREFKQWEGANRDVPAIARKVLVTMGGGDANNATAMVLNALQATKISELEVVLVIGGSNPHRSSLEEAASHSNYHIRLERNTIRMPELMAWSDIAVSAGGGTSYELAFLRVPAVLITVSENQVSSCRIFAEEGAAIHAGWYHSLDTQALAQSMLYVVNSQSLRKSLAENGLRIVDGRGSERVVQAITLAAKNNCEG